MNCRYCGLPAGFLRWVHDDCKRLHEDGTAQILALISSQPFHAVDTLPDQIQSICSKSYIASEERTQLLLKGWKAALENCLEDGALDEAEESYLANLRNKFDLSQLDLDRDGSYSRAAKAAVLRSVMNGEIPQKVQIQGALPFNFQKGEKIVWVFQGVSYVEDKTYRRYVGSSSGVSVRVARGVYYRMSGYRGHPIDYNQRTKLDVGTLAITDKSLYFGGTTKSFRIPFKKIVSFQPFTDGIGLFKDTANARAQIFITQDGWFTHNLLTNLCHLE